MTYPACSLSKIVHKIITKRNSRYVYSIANSEYSSFSKMIISNFKSKAVKRSYFHSKIGQLQAIGR